MLVSCSTDDGGRSQAYRTPNAPTYGINWGGTFRMSDPEGVAVASWHGVPAVLHITGQDRPLDSTTVGSRISRLPTVIVFSSKQYNIACYC